MADITDRAEVSRATFYVYFASKDDVFRVLTEQLRDEFLEAQRARAADRDDPVGVATAAVTDFVDVYAANLAFITVLEHQALTDPTGAGDVAGHQGAAAEKNDPVRADPGRRMGVAHPVAPPDMVATAASGMAVRFAPLIAARPADRDADHGPSRAPLPADPGHRLPRIRNGGDSVNVRGSGTVVTGGRRRDRPRLRAKAGGRRRTGGGQ